MDAEMEALAEALAPTARVGLADMLSWTPPDYEAAERQRWLRLVIAALGIEHATKPARFAQLNVPARFVTGIADALRTRGFVVRTGRALTEEYRAVTVWQVEALKEELAAEDAAELAMAAVVVEEEEQGRGNDNERIDEQA